MEFLEYPKWVNGPNGRVIVQTREEEDALLGKPKEKKGWPYEDVPVPEATVALPTPEPTAEKPAPRKKAAAKPKKG